MPCSCWYQDENGKLQKRRCTDEEKRYQSSFKNPLCGFAEGTQKRAQALEILNQMEQRAKEKEQEEEEKSRELLEEGLQDDARFLREVNHGRAQES